MTKLALRDCRFLAAAGGLVDFVVDEAILDYDLPAAAGAENLTYNYNATYSDDDVEEWESGDGLFNTSTGTLARTVIIESSNNNQKVNFSGIPEVTMGQLQETPPPDEMGILGKAVYSTAQTNTTVTIPAGVHKAEVILWGATGGSGATIGTASGPTGGAGYLEK